MPTAKSLMNEINAALGGKVLRLASDTKKQEVIPSGVGPIDYLLNGGFPKGRMTEIFGAPSALKSYLGLCAIREAQKRGGVGALLDTERTFDREWAEEIGVNLEKLILWPPADEDAPITGEQALDVAEALLRSKGVDIMVFDSVAAALPQELQNKRMSGESVQPGRLAAMMSLGLRKLTAANEDTAIIWVNQLRTNIGVTFGNPESAPGGKALPYYSTIRLNIKQIGKLTDTRKIHDGDKLTDTRVQIGQKFKAITEKNKLDAPGQEVLFTWLNDQSSIDEIGFLMSMALYHGVVITRGAMWDFDGHSYRGKGAMRSALTADLTLREKVRQEVFSSRGAHGRPKTRAVSTSDEPSESEELDPIQAVEAVASGSTVPRKKS